MVIPASIQKELIPLGRLLTKGKVSSKEATNLLFDILKNTSLLGWLRKEILNNFNLEYDEIESELYLFCANLIRYFDSYRSSLTPYLSKYIPWLAEKLKKELSKQSLKEIPSGIKYNLGSYMLDELFYLSPEKILFYNSDFTKEERFLILRILSSNNNELSKTQLANKCNMSRETIRPLLNKIKEKF